MTNEEKQAKGNFEQAGPKSGILFLGTVIQRRFLDLLLFDRVAATRAPVAFFFLLDACTPFVAASRWARSFFRILALFCGVTLRKQRLTFLIPQNRSLAGQHIKN